MTLHIGDLYGPGCPHDSRIGRLVWDALRSQPLTLDDPAGTLRPLHTRDLVGALSALLRTAPAEPVLSLAGAVVTSSELAEVVRTAVRPVPLVPSGPARVPLPRAPPGPRPRPAGSRSRNFPTGSTPTPSGSPTKASTTSWRCELRYGCRPFPSQAGWGGRLPPPAPPGPPRLHRASDRRVVGIAPHHRRQAAARTGCRTAIAFSRIAHCATSSIVSAPAAPAPSAIVTFTQKARAYTCPSVSSSWSANSRL
ncbi:hypothetical protein SALB_00455 [Streptomyces noursei]|uniref:Uncharacterized protein n=1 Tax=Streptomyces noursei TaxID=1971 RepID=A0A401QQV9_STRNR|nr:hypothetical protein SALB_00455 [Streptomyces noursei]